MLYSYISVYSSGTLFAIAILCILAAVFIFVAMLLCFAVFCLQKRALATIGFVVGVIGSKSVVSSVENSLIYWIGSDCSHICINYSLKMCCCIAESIMPGINLVYKRWWFCFVLKATYWDRIRKRRELIVGLWLVTGEKIALVEWFKCIKLHTELLPLYSLHYRNLLCLSGEITAYGVENVHLTCLIKGIRREARIKYLQTVTAMTAMGSSLQVYWRWRV